MKGKVVSAILNGLPVVGTRISFEGLEESLVPRESLAETHEELVSRIAQVLQHDAVWKQVWTSQVACLGPTFERAQEKERVAQVLNAQGPLAGV